MVGVLEHRRAAGGADEPAAAAFDAGELRQHQEFGEAEEMAENLELEVALPAA
jgi:hypothetical protein